MDLVGKRFGKLIVKEKHPERTRSGKVQWVCICDCGNETVTYTGSLNSGNTKSCGCQRAIAARSTGKSKITHGMTGSSEYKAWQSMRERCYRESSENYPHYGGRGISVCDEWRNSFENFLRDMGSKPSPDLSLERKDTNGNYTPNNCHWASIQTQNNNKRSNRFYLWEGEMLTLVEISRRTGIPYETLSSRINRMGLGINEAVTWKRYKHVNKGA